MSSPENTGKNASTLDTSEWLRCYEEKKECCKKNGEGWYVANAASAYSEEPSQGTKCKGRKYCGSIPKNAADVKTQARSGVILVDTGLLDL